jgi:hypothetical protein
MESRTRRENIDAKDAQEFEAAIGFAGGPRLFFSVNSGAPGQAWLIL